MNRFRERGIGGRLGEDLPSAQVADDQVFIADDHDQQRGRGEYATERARAWG